MGLRNDLLNRLTGIAPAFRAFLQDLYVRISLPPIRGNWYFVDPQSGASTNNGRTIKRAFANITSAYAACTSGAGDGIAIISSGTTTAHTTSYLIDGEEIDWTKNAITVVGVSSGCRMFGRARIASKATTGDALTYMIDVQGDNNAFINLHIANFGSDATALGGVIVSGNRNYFENCHFIGAGNATPGAETGAYSLKINGGQENTFEKCTFGTDSVIKAAANGEIIFDGTAWRNTFYDCDIRCYSATAGKGAVNFSDTSAISGVQIFSRCRFINWNENGIAASTAAFIGSTPTSGEVLIDSCSLVGWSAWDATAKVYVANSDATASGAGGIATTV